MTNDDLWKLHERFPESDIEWRIGNLRLDHGTPKGTCLAYLTNRAIMDRLDDVCGPSNWKNEFATWHDKSQLCGISIKIDGEWVTKWDGAGGTDIETIKGGLSDAQKRTAVQWGIGRYLYDLPVTYAVFSTDGIYSAKAKGEDGKDKWFKWNPPKLPPQFLPGKIPFEQKRAFFEQVCDAMGRGDTTQVSVLWAEWKDADDRAVLWGMFPSHLRSAMKAMKVDG